MNCKVGKSQISGRITCPPNKSYTHRAVFIASLAEGKSIISNILESEDTLATIDACKKFGATILKNDSELEIIGNKEIKSAYVDAKNSGTTIRIACAIAGLGNGNTKLDGDSSLQKRPMQLLLDSLEEIGAKCTSTNGCPPLTVNGLIRGGEVSIPGNVSSQFLSALLIISPKTEKGLILNIDGDMVSKPYLNATIVTMKKFGVEVEVKIPYKKYIVKPQKYRAADFVVPSDFSSLALLLAASILVGKEFTIEITSDDLPQADKKFIEIIKKLGVEVNVENNFIKVNPIEKIGGGNFDLSDSPDLLPPLSILALKASQKIRIFNVKHARYKETDRIAILASELSKIGVNVKENEDGLELSPPEKIKGSELNSHHDHRLFMSFCIAAMYVGNCIVTDYESVSVSYPNFVSEMKKVGSDIQLDV